MADTIMKIKLAKSEFDGSAHAPMYDSIEDLGAACGWSPSQIPKVKRDMLATDPDAPREPDTTLH